jgi:hypothetical protein
MSETKYPEHEKIVALKGDNTKIGDFLTWLDEQGVRLCKLEEDDEDEAANRRRARARDYVPWNQSIEKILAAYFEIDQAKLDAEKQAMYNALRGVEQLIVDNQRP